MNNEFVITIQGVLWLCSAIAIIGGATLVISRWLMPFKKIKERLDACEKELENCKRYQSSDHKELEKVEIGIEKICKCTLAITDHELTGNSVDKLREAKDEMQNYLIQK